MKQSVAPAPKFQDLNELVESSYYERNSNKPVKNLAYLLEEFKSMEECIVQSIWEINGSNFKVSYENLSMLKKEFEVQELLQA